MITGIDVGNDIRLQICGDIITISSLDPEDDFSCLTLNTSQIQTAIEALLILEGVHKRAQVTE
jgi:hypothetical protein